MKIKELLKDIDPMTFDAVLEYVSKNALKSDKKLFIVTPNVEILMLQMDSPEYQSVIKRADLALADSVGVLIGGKILGVVIKERVPGSILIEKVCEAVSKQPITVGFLGGRPGVALKAAECLMRKYPGLKVAFSLSEWPLDSASLKLKCDILFVAFGSPKQEIWIDKNLDKVNVKVAIGVGGAFDYLAGEVRRAPKLVRDLGMEWLFRLINQPWRAKRQIKLIRFSYLVLKEKISDSVL